MTTILADSRLGVMVSDSHATDEDRSWSERKVFRLRGALVATSGIISEGASFMDWYKAGADGDPQFEFGESDALVLDEHGLWRFNSNGPRLMRVPRGIEAIGSGAKGAICAYEALGWASPKKAVRIACNHDFGSRPPVRLYRL